MKSHRAPLIVVAAVVAIACFSIAQSSSDPMPSRDEVLQLLDVSRQSVEDMQQRVTSMVVAQEALQHPDAGIPPAERQKRIEELYSFSKNIPFDKMTDVLVAVYQRHFSHSDIQQLIAFYRSPVGTKLRTQQPQITMEFMQGAMPIVLQYMHDEQKRKDSR